MNKYLSLWKKCEELLRQEGITFDPLDPEIEDIDVPGNRSDVIAMTILVRLCHQLAWKAKGREGDLLRSITVHEIGARVLPYAIREAKILKGSRD